MDDDLKELETELKQLRPRGPSRELAECVGEALAPSHRRLGVGTAWLALPVAAALVVAFLAARRLGPGPAEVSRTASFKPVEAENILIDAIDEGYTTLTDGTPVRRVRQSYLDTITWRDSRTKASLTWSVPREEIQVVPVLFQ